MKQSDARIGQRIRIRNNAYDNGETGIIIALNDSEITIARDDGEGHEGRDHGYKGPPISNGWYVSYDDAELIEDVKTPECIITGYRPDRLAAFVESAKQIIESGSCRGVDCGKCPCCSTYNNGNPCDTRHHGTLDGIPPDWFRKFLRVYDPTVKIGPWSSLRGIACRMGSPGVFDDIAASKIESPLVRRKRLLKSL